MIVENRDATETPHLPIAADAEKHRVETEERLVTPLHVVPGSSHLELVHEELLLSVPTTLAETPSSERAVRRLGESPYAKLLETGKSESRVEPGCGGHPALSSIADAAQRVEEDQIWFGTVRLGHSGRSTTAIVPVYRAHDLTAVEAAAPAV